MDESVQTAWRRPAFVGKRGEVIMIIISIAYV